MKRPNDSRSVVEITIGENGDPDIYSFAEKTRPSVKRLVENSDGSVKILSDSKVINLKIESDRKKMAATSALLESGKLKLKGLKMRSYQEDGVRWMINRIDKTHSIRGGILADEMGVGKTIQVIALLASTGTPGKTSLIIAPTSIQSQWAAEIKKFTDFDPIMYYGTDREKELVKIRPDIHNIIITTYGVIVEEFKKNSKSDRFYIISSMMFSIVWESVFLDEGHEIRTKKTKRHLAVMRLKTERRWIITGTPVHNSAKDFMSLLLFIGIQPQELAGIKKRLGYRLTRKDGLKMLKDLSEKYMLRREKSGIPSLILPKKNLTLVTLKLSNAEQEIYNALHSKCVLQFNTFVKEGTVLQNYAQVLVLINKLRRAACHPILGISVEDRSKLELTDLQRNPSTKIIAMMRHIRHFLFQEHRKIVLFSQWTSLLDLIQAFLDGDRIRYVRYDGKMSVQQRNDAIVKFKTANNIGIILVSLKAGGQGLNLCEGSVALFADHWWNSAAEDQATDRIHRIGQTRPVDVVKFTTFGTIEENVLMLQQKKRLHEHALLGDEKTFEGLQLQDLKLLFKRPGDELTQ